MGLQDNYDKKMKLSAEVNRLRDEFKRNTEILVKLRNGVANAQQFQNLFSTEAGQMALEMYNAGGSNGRISASVWNAYAEGHEGRTTISENSSISVFDAMNSITTYMVREEARENGPDAKPTEEQDPNIDYD